MLRVCLHLMQRTNGTVKLFFVSGAEEDVASRTKFAKEALTAVEKALGVEKFDTLILSLPGVVLEKDEEDYKSKQFPVPENTVKSWLDTWELPQWGRPR